MRTTLPTLGALLALVLALAAGAEVYKWTDENGTVHYSQDYNTLPAKSRQARPRSEPAATIEVMENLHVQDDGTPTPEEPAASAYEIDMRTAVGGNHLVWVELNDRVTVQMLLDTGASDVVITEATARRLGIGERQVLRYQRYSTANGVVTQPVIRLKSVSVGGARARGVLGSVSSSMSRGLLGTSYLSKFDYSISGSKLILSLKK